MANFDFGFFRLMTHWLEEGNFLQRKLAKCILAYFLWKSDYSRKEIRQVLEEHENKKTSDV